ncbi:hypothetical protein [Bosea lathyri]|uniref:hypothetical protein n=1 Tax=Bosea lathyri TaxID=1036778 RepID=UPI0011B0334E|nr:hypothetical protein [Bosea lathyri]
MRPDLDRFRFQPMSSRGVVSRPVHKRGGRQTLGLTDINAQKRGDAIELFDPPSISPEPLVMLALEPAAPLGFEDFHSLRADFGRDLDQFSPNIIRRRTFDDLDHLGSEIRAGALIPPLPASSRRFRLDGLILHSVTPSKTDESELAFAPEGVRETPNDYAIAIAS